MHYMLQALEDLPEGLYMYMIVHVMHMCVHVHACCKFMYLFRSLEVNEHVHAPSKALQIPVSALQYVHIPCNVCIYNWGKHEQGRCRWLSCTSVRPSVSTCIYVFVYLPGCACAKVTCTQWACIHVCTYG